MLEVLFFSDRDLRRRLFDRVKQAERPLLVTALRTLGEPVREKEPFASLERDHGAVVDQLVLADDGSVTGMWRDPMADLVEALVAEPSARAAAANGYLLVVRGKVLTTVKKGASAAVDRRSLQEALARFVPAVPRPTSAERRGGKARRHESDRHRRAAQAQKDEEEAAVTDDDARAEGPPGSAPLPRLEELLGLEAGAPRDEARRRFRALIAQYHPDKVAHLAPEFRELAERRTRELLAAWERFEAER